MQLNKVVRIGDVGMWNGIRANVFCKIELKEGRLSISGVEGPKRNGDALGSCGQIDMHLREAQDTINLAPNWTREKLARFFDVWKKWHLNDMQPACVHQREMGWGELAEKKVTLYRFRLTISSSDAQKRITKATSAATLRGEVRQPAPEEITYLSLPYSFVWHSSELPEPISHHYEPAKPLYSGDKGATEEKTLGWLRQDEHPEGILSKACPTCGCKYGSAWLREEVPQDVINFLQSLPDTDVIPAWV